MGEMGEMGEMGKNFSNHLIYFTGIFQRRADQDYRITLSEPERYAGQIWMLITVQPDVNQKLQHYADQQPLEGWGCFNLAGNWLLVNCLSSSQKLEKN